MASFMQLKMIWPLGVCLSLMYSLYAHDPMLHTVILMPTRSDHVFIIIRASFSVHWPILSYAHHSQGPFPVSTCVRPLARKLLTHNGCACQPLGRRVSACVEVRALGSVARGGAADRQRLFWHGLQGEGRVEAPASFAVLAIPSHIALPL